MKQYLDDIYLGNTVEDYLWVLGAVLFGFVFLRFLAHRISNIIFRLIAGKTQGVDKEELYQLLQAPLKWLIMLVVVFIGTSHLDYPAEWEIGPKNEFGIRMVLSLSLIHI